MKKQLITRVPSTVALADIPAPLMRLLRDHIGLINPASWQMPGTRVYAGWRVIHFACDAGAADIKWLFDTINDAGVIDWRIEAGQDYELQHTRDGDGNIISTEGVYKPVPLAMVNWLEDIILYDEDGNPIGTERPVAGVSLHTYAGADPWVWAEP